MRVDHLQSWLEEETCEERLDTANWEQVVEIPQPEIRYGRVLTECAWQTVVLIPKENGEFRGIGHVEVLWKALSGVINRQIGAAVKFHNVLHEFWTGQGMVTISLEVKLIQKLTEIREEFL